jgi:hypothetical protein
MLLLRLKFLIFKDNKGISEINNSGNINAVNAMTSGFNTHG